METDKKRKGKVEDEHESDSESGQSDQEEIVNVDFDFFSPKEIDFHALKNLLRQLLGPDSQSFDVSSLADIVIKQKDLGSTVKADGEESDPFALLSVINLQQHMV
jgi:protein BCP1